MARITDKVKSINRNNLLEAAAEEFARRGLRGANINEISLAAGLAKGTVYNYFPSKEALFLAVLETACVRAAAGADRIPSTAPTRDRLLAAIESDIDWARENEPFARVLVRETLSANPRFFPQMLKAAAPFINKLEEILRDGVKRGEIRADIPATQLALMLVGMDELALVQYWGSGGEWPTLDEIPEFIVRLFLEGAAAQYFP